MRQARRHRFTIVVLSALAAESAAQGQLIVGGGFFNSFIWNVDPTGVSPPTVLASGVNVWGMAYDPDANDLYWSSSEQFGCRFYRATFNAAGLTPISIGGLTQVTSAVHGLAFDVSTHSLYGTQAGSASTTISRIDTTTGSVTPVVTLSNAPWFLGFDYDPATNRFYGTTSSFGVVGGLYQIEFRYGAPTWSLVAPFPNNDDEVDGLALGNGRAYLVNEGTPIYVYNFATGLYEAPLSSPQISPAVLVAGATYVPGSGTLSPLVLVCAATIRRRRGPR